jgi:hypothetical protein
LNPRDGSQFVRPRLGELTETYLNSLIAVALCGLDLRDRAGTRLNDGDRHQTTIREEDLGHANLRSENCLIHRSVAPPKFSESLALTA